VVEHELLVNAVLAGDGQAAEKLISEHLENVRIELVELLVHMVLPFAEHGV
jgi:DNA-binding GntR family transcriptional regulator